MVSVVKLWKWKLFWQLPTVAPDWQTGKWERTPFSPHLLILRQISADSGRHSGPVKISIDSTGVDDSSAQSGQKLVDTFTDATPTLCLFRAHIWL